MTRILKVTNTRGRSPYFVPQQCVNGLWIEFIGYMPDSPYLQPKSFDSEQEARTFLTDPGIYRVGNCGPGINAIHIK